MCIRPVRMIEIVSINVMTVGLGRVMGGVYGGRVITSRGVVLVVISGVIGCPGTMMSMPEFPWDPP